MHAKLKTTESYRCFDNCRIINILLGFTCYQCYFTFMVTYNKSNTHLLSIKKQRAIYIQKIHTKWRRFPTSCFWCGVVALHFVHLKIATNRIAPSKDFWGCIFFFSLIMWFLLCHKCQVVHVALAKSSPLPCLINHKTTSEKSRKVGAKERLGI